MPIDFLHTDIAKLNGIGDKTLKLYDKLLSKNKKSINEGNFKFIDLLFYLPDKILQRRVVKDVQEINQSDIIIAKLQVVSHNKPIRAKQPYTVICYLGQNFVTIVFYKYFENYINIKLKIDSEVFVSGKTEIFNSQIQIVHPDYIASTLEQIPVIEPIYPLTSGLTNKDLIKNIDFIVKNIPNLPEWIENDILKSHGWLSWKESLENLHKPKTIFDPRDNVYIRRLAFDEILAQQLALAITRSETEKTYKIVLNRGRSILKDKLIQKILTFELTDDQKNAIEEIENDVFSNRRMIRLLQGDVGSGKTIVSIITMLNYIENKKQCALIVPTSILAQQHFEKIKEIGEKLNLNVALLTGKVKNKNKEEIFIKAKSGEIDILIGTHALIEDNVEFKDLGLVVIDEQHRFGVRQRLALINKGNNPDILAMSATPIPRTLALTIYNSMDLTTIYNKPAKRKDIITTIINIKNKYEELLLKIKEKLLNNEKIYWVCPLVEESENIDLTNVKNKYEEFCRIFGDENVDFIHGKMKEDEKDKIMDNFCKNANGKILISTTVIEVGIDIKDATIIVIEHPERFGLSQLHQLRGRVGRGEKQSYCILLYNEDNCSKNTIRRLNIMRSTNNGFTIAEEDLKIRGIGEVMGIKQSGQQQYRIADLDRDFDLLQQATYYVNNILKNNLVRDYLILLDIFGYKNYIDSGLLN